MTENKDKIIDKDKDKKTENDMVRDKEKDASKEDKQPTKEQQLQQPPHQHDRYRRLSQFLVLLNIPRHHSHNHSPHHANNNQQHNQKGNGRQSGGNSNATSQQHSPLTPHAVSSSSFSLANAAACQLTVTVNNDNNNLNNNSCNSLATYPAVVVDNICEEQQMQELHLPPHLPSNHNLPRSSCASFQSEILLLDLKNGDLNDYVERALHKDEFGTQRVYKKTSPNCVLTLYLPSREICLSGSSPSVLRGIVFVDPKAIQGYRVYAQLTLTFRYGREDEEVMGLRFCNEAIMSLHQIWPRNEEPNVESLSPLQEALLKRLGEGAHPFTLTLTAQAPPSVQLVPAKRYYGAPIGTSYDVRCFIADKSDDKFHRRASVKMGVRVIYRTDVFNHGITGPENFTSLVNNPLTSPPPQAITMTTATTTTITPSSSHSTHTTISENQSDTEASLIPETSLQATHSNETRSLTKVRKSDRGESFPKIRLSPKAFRFSSRFGRSKSEAEKCPNDSFHNYSKSFQEYDSICPTSGGPQGAVDKPFLLQDGRVGLRASLDKSWYTHGEDVCVTINIRNDSRKTVRKVRVCAIQHVDVCMFNNGKFKNVVADSDAVSPPPIEQHVAPGCTLNTTVTLKPQRGATKNWIALEDTLQRSTEPDEINADIAASALRTPHFLMQATHSPNKCSSPGVLIPPTALTNAISHAPTNSDERNVFAIYVSYYVKVKLTLSGMGGELSLKLPFLLVHIDEEQRLKHEKLKIQLDEVPTQKRNCKSLKNHDENDMQESMLTTVKPNSLDRIESLDAENVHIKVTHVSSCDGDGVVEAALNTEAEDEIAEEPQPSTSLALQRRRRSFMRCESIDHGLEDDADEAKPVDLEKVFHVAQIHKDTVEEETEVPTEDDEVKS